jgi:hypothetical protein
MQKMRLESCLKALRKLAGAENSDILENALAYYEKNKFLTPKLAFVVLWRLQHNKIDHSRKFGAQTRATASLPYYLRCA